MRTYESALDIIFVTVDFIVGALTIPLRWFTKGIPGMSLNAELVFGKFFGSAIEYHKADSWGAWFWVMLLALVLVYM